MLRGVEERATDRSTSTERLVAGTPHGWPARGARMVPNATGPTRREAIERLVEKVAAFE